MKTSTAVQSEIWSTAGGGTGRTGLWLHAHRTESQPMQSLKASAGVQAAVVFDAEHRAIIADMGGSVRSFARDGRQLWNQALDGAISATPAVDVERGRVFVGTHAGWLYSLKNSDGTVLWRSRLPSSSDPRIVADLLFLNDPDRVLTSSWGGRFHAIEAGSGATLHTWDAGISPRAAASADSQNRVYCLRAVRDEGVSLVRVNPDGKETVLHRRAEGERPANRAVVAAAPVIDKAALYFISNGDRSGQLHAWDLAVDKLVWTVEFDRAIVATPALRPDGVLMVADMSGILSAVDAGSIRFRYNTGCEYLLAGPVCNGSSETYLGDPVGLVHRVDARGDGRSIFDAGRAFQARPSWNPKGDLYIPSMDGRVQIFRNIEPD